MLYTVLKCKCCREQYSFLNCKLNHNYYKDLLFKTQMLLICVKFLQ